MLYHFFYSFKFLDSGFFNVFRYITFRSIISFIIAFLASLILGKYFIDFIRKKQFSQVIRNDGPESHKKKIGTPTMGGVFIGISVVMACLLAGNFFSFPFLGGLFIFISFFILGFIDDYLKILKKNSKGVSARAKLFWQFLVSIAILYWLVHTGAIDSKLYYPFLKDAYIDLGYFYVLFGAFVIVGTSNAVNLTDGLDGLAVGTVLVSAVTLGLLCYVAGHFGLSSYLLIPYIENSGELLIVISAIVGAGIGFLWYNTYPAQIFMGDVGSLSLGGVLGIVSVITKNELLFVLIGGVFVIEALSVIIQVFSYKVFKKRVFKMAPIHHHFELLGWRETKVVVRFWIISVALALISLATLKMR